MHQNAQFRTTKCVDQVEQEELCCLINLQCDFNAN